MQWSLRHCSAIKRRVRWPGDLTQDCRACAFAASQIPHLSGRSSSFDCSLHAVLDRSRSCMLLHRVHSRSAFAADVISWLAERTHLLYTRCTAGLEVKRQHRAAVVKAVSADGWKDINLLHHLFLMQGCQSIRIASFTCNTHTIGHCGNTTRHCQVCVLSSTWLTARPLLSKK